MIVAFSTSSPWASVAFISNEGEVLWSETVKAPRAASGHCLEMLKRAEESKGLSLADADLFLADMGPGSFTGVRVGIILAKTFGWLYGKQCAGADSFDLVSATGVVVLPSKKNEWFVRISGETPVRTTELPATEFTGYGFEGDEQPPSAERFAQILSQLKPVPAEAFVPAYLIDPSISTPKKPYQMVQGA